MDTEANTQAQGANVGPKVIRANKFILEDGNGKERAELNVTKDAGPGLWLVNEKGNPRVILNLTKYGPGLGLTDEKGNPRAMLNVTKDGPGLSLYDENGKVIWSAP